MRERYKGIGMEEKQSRRNFLIHAGRYGAVAAITYSVSKFIVRGIGQECVNESICDACTSVTRCELPLGMEYKAQQAQEASPINLDDLPQQRGQQHG